MSARCCSVEGDCTDCATVETAASSPTFQNLSEQGLLLTSYYAMTHPSEPNYIAVAGGDFFGNAADDFREFH